MESKVSSDRPWAKLKRPVVSGLNVPLVSIIDSQEETLEVYENEFIERSMLTREQNTTTIKATSSIGRFPSPQRKL